MTDAAGIDPDAPEVYARSGIGGRVGFGSRPALVVVDLQNGFTDPESPSGSNLDGVMAATARLLAAARAARLPIAFTAVRFHPSLRDGTTWLRKMPGMDNLVEGSSWSEIDSRVAPLGDEPVWAKRAPSAFFGTPLHPFLVSEAVDTLIVAGCVTSGCVRATVVDAYTCGFKTIVAEEAVFDRAQVPHVANLFDMAMKYADVEPSARVLDYLETCP
jgi:nicotinamidase-related amidase